MARAQIRVTGAVTDTVLIAAPGAGYAIRIDRVHFTVSAAATVSLTAGADAAGTRIIDLDLGSNGGIVMDPTGDALNFRPVCVLPANTALNITNSAGNLKGAVEYAIIPG